MLYTDKALEHFMNPRNVGELADADGFGETGSAECGDLIRVWIKVDKGYLSDVKYKVFGCPAAIACCSVMSELAMGRDLRGGLELTDDKVAEAVGGLPAGKHHCSNLAATTLHKAIKVYIGRGVSEMRWPG